MPDGRLKLCGYDEQHLGETVEFSYRWSSVVDSCVSSEENFSGIKRVKRFQNNEYELKI